jgi:hypothetical protein
MKVEAGRFVVFSSAEGSTTLDTAALLSERLTTLEATKAGNLEAAANILESSKVSTQALQQKIGRLEVARVSRGKEHVEQTTTLRAQRFALLQNLKQQHGVDVPVT